MFTEINTYTPDEVFLTFGGAIVEGWETISVSRTSPEFKTVKGIRGKNTRVSDPNTHSVIQVVCNQTSITNEIFSSIVALDASSEGVRLEVMLIDSSGWEVFSSEEAYIAKTSDRQYAVTMGTRTWEIECLTARWNDEKGGNIGNNIFSRIAGMF